MVSTRFLFSGLTRRWIPNILVIFIIAIPTAIDLIIVTFSGTVSQQIGSVGNPQVFLTPYLLEQFVFFLGMQWILISILGGIALWVVGSTIAERRKEDILLLRKLGTPSETLRAFVYIEIVIVTGIGISLGVVLNHFLGIPLIQNITGLPPVTPLLPYLITLGVFLGLTYVGSFVPTSKHIHAQIHNAQHRDQYPTPSWLEPQTRKQGIWRRAIQLYRQYPANHRTQLILILILIGSFSMAIFSGTLTQSSLNNQIQNAVGIPNSYIVGSNETLSYFEGIASLTNPPTFSYDATDNLMNQSVMITLENLSYISIDPRLIMPIDVQEIPTTKIEDGEYVRYGMNRNGTAVLISVDPSRVQGQWYGANGTPNTLVNSTVVVGDTLSVALFEEATKQFIEINSSILTISGVVFDPIAQGNTVYIHNDLLFSLLHIVGTNLLFITLNETASNGSLQELISTVTNLGLEIRPLTLLSNDSTAFVVTLFSPFGVIPLLAVAITIVSLSTLLIFNTMNNLGDYTTIHAIGGGKKEIQQILSLHLVIIFIQTIPMGVTIGSFLSFITSSPQPYLHPLITALLIGGEILNLPRGCGKQPPEQKEGGDYSF
ncbi:MAG: FtsX-like permease family protein [Candidatus Ranarchaeia archaeon]|jgi:ABC-type antimicrobial peptide transport system permease subunit